MSDRTSAEIFSTVFEMLAESPTDENKKLARRLWDETFRYDFSESQLDCDDVLVALGLARRRGERVVYKKKGER